MIALVDYGASNLGSVHKALLRFASEVERTSDPAVISRAQAVVLPGQGAFGQAMEGLNSFGLVEPIKAALAEGKPYLGICIGLQLLFEAGEESPGTRGLGVLPGRVVRFPQRIVEDQRLKVPHMGWNQVVRQRDCPALTGIDSGAYVYFVHSYYPAPEDPSVVATTTDYGIEFVSSVTKSNLFACQFHPEKSQQVGLKILENFCSTL